MNHRLPLSLLATALGAVLAAPAHAGQAIRQPEVVVTASRLPQDVERPLASVTVLSRTDIEASQAPDLLALLQRQAGFDLARTGGPGSATTMFLRGTSSNHTLVLIDGMRVNAAGQGLFDLAHLPLDQIERIEIVRGPRAALWGSDAIGGVLHITTRDPDGTAATVRGGSYGRAEGSLSAGGRSGDSHFGMTAGAVRLRGFSATNENAWGHDPDNDGYRNRNLSLRGGTALGNQQLEAHLVATDADVEFDTGESDVRNTAAGMRLAGELGAGWSHSLALGHSREDLATPTFGTELDSRRNALDWVNVFALGNGSISAGLGWQRDQAHSLSGGQTTYRSSRRNLGGFAAYAGRFGDHDLEAAVRHDDNSQFGGNTTGSAGWGWNLGEIARLRLGWGQGFRAPSLNELYHPGFGGMFAGNPDLDPERSRSLEAGLDLAFGTDHRLGLAAYRTRVHDLIAFAGENLQAINIERAQIDGVELDYRGRVAAWQFEGNLGWLDPVNATTGQPLLRRAKRKANASVGHDFANGLFLALDASYLGDRPDAGFHLPSHTLWHLRAALPLGSAWRIEARVENLFDKDYELVRGYNTPDRSVVVGLHWQPAR